MISVSLTDGYGSGKRQKVNGEGEMGVVIHTHPPIDEEHPSLPFRQYFTTDGSSTGGNDMRVNGSASSVDFYIGSPQIHDIYLRTLNIEVADAGARFDKFGALTTLTNGVQILYSSSATGDLDIHEGIKDNITFFRLSGQTPTITDLSGGGADSVQITVDLAKTFGVPFGVRLTKGSKDKLTIRVKDDLSVGLDSFNAFGYGVIV